MKPSKTVTAGDISAVMAELGRRNRGKHQTMTAAALRQRRQAGRASGAARRAARRKPGPPRAHNATSTIPLAQNESITCTRCGFKSYHPEDINSGYCGNCHAFHT